MKHPYRSGTSSLQDLQRHRLIADIQRIVEILNVDIAEEEAQAGISDPTRPGYPTTARALIARRENLEQTVASLLMRPGPAQ